MSETLEHWFIFQNDTLLIRTDNLPPLAFGSDRLAPYFLRTFSLGHFNHQPCYCAEFANHPPPPHSQFVPLRKAFDVLGHKWYGAATKAISIINWDKTHQFCGRCGDRTQYKIKHFERICITCGLTFYPRISPSIIVLIKKDDHLLMARSPHFSPGAYGLIAGFVEAGENVEETVCREVQEEIGIEIKNLCYFGSQPWPFPDALMLAFTADYAAGDITIDQKEIEAAGWYRYDQLPGRPSYPISIAQRLIENFVNEQKRIATASKKTSNATTLHLE